MIDRAEESAEIVKKLKDDLNIFEIDNFSDLNETDRLKSKLYLNRNKELYNIQRFICSDFLEKFQNHQIPILDCEKHQADKICQNLKKALANNISSDNFFKLLETSFEDIQDLNDSDESSSLEKIFAKKFHLIKKLRNACLILETTPLHCLISKGYTDYAKWLIKNGADIHVVNSLGHSPLEAGIRKRDFELVKFMHAMSFEDYERILKKKDLLVSFGIFKFGLSKRETLNCSYGLDDEGFKQIVPYLEKYLQDEEKINKDGDDVNKLKKILDIFKQGIKTNRSTKKLIQLLDSKRIIVGSSGFLGHIIGYILCKEDEKYILTITEKGELAYKADGSPLHKNERGGASSIFSIEVPQKEIKWLLTYLKEADSTIRTKISAKVFFFTTIPSKFASDWQFNTSLHTKEYKEEICFYSNIKTLLMYLFVKTYGSEELGYQKYKTFNLYMRKHSLEDYRLTVGEDDLLAARGKEIIDMKSSKMSVAHAKT